MYTKLLIQNVKRSTKDYLIYIVTLILCIMMFYSFLSISSKYYHVDLGVTFDLNILSDGMKMAIVCITFLILFLIHYVNRYMILQKQPEFALQTIMGMERNTTALLFFFETFVMGILAIFIGIIFGSFTSQFITGMLLSFFGKPYTFSFMLFPDTLFITIAFFLFCFLIIGFKNITTIKKIKIITMLQSNQENDYSIKKSKYFSYITILYVILLFYMTYIGISKLYYYYDERHPLPVRLMFFGNILAPLFSLLLTAYWAIHHKKYGFPKLVFFLLFGMIPIMLFISSVPILYLNDYLTLGNDSLNHYLLFLLFCIIYFISALIYLSSVVLEAWKERSIACRYKEENLFLFGQLLSKLKTNTKSMTLISLTLTISLGLFLTNSILIEWALGYLEQRTVYDIQIASSYENVIKERDLPNDNYDFVTTYLKENKISIKDDCLFSLYLPQKSDFYKRNKYDFPSVAISLSDYNHLLTIQGFEPITLKDNEFTTQWKSIATDHEIASFLKNTSHIVTDGGTLTLSYVPTHNEILGEYLYNLYTNFIYIFPDAVCQQLLPVENHCYMMTTSPLPYEIAMDLQSQFETTYQDKENGMHYFLRTKTKETNTTLASMFILKCSMVYGAIVLLIMCFTILSLQQLSESTQLAYRFRVLQKLGVSETNRNRLLLKQMGFWFGLPIIVAIVSITIFMLYFFFTTSIQIHAYINVTMLLEQLLSTIAILILLFICYFIVTWILLHRSISK